MSESANPSQPSLEASSPYQPLNRETTEIRLFDLSPGKDDDPITGRLRVVSLARKPKFDALSYVWGTPEPQTVITLRDGHSISIGPSLHLALSDLRPRWRPLTLWVDALCINQHDDEEKAHQVPLMSTIFRETRMMRAWLNQEIDPKCPALRALPWLVENEKYNGKVQATPCWPNTIKRRLHMLQEVESQNWNFWKPAIDIFKNEYWSRLWIQQELIIPRKVNFQIRKTEIAGQHIFRFRDNLQLSWISKRSSDADRPGHRLPLAYTQLLRRNTPVAKRIRRYESNLPLIYLVQYSCEFQTSNQRDMVYGCLALANRHEISTLRVDYTLPISQVYTDVIRNHLIYWKNLDFMLFKTLQDYEKYPTWLPAPDRKPDFEVWLGDMPLELNWLRIPASVSDDGLRLEVQAYQLDRVAHIPSISPLIGGPARVLQAVSECYLQIHPEGTEEEVWSADCLIGILKWQYIVGEGSSPAEDTDRALRGCLR
ncbi:hypothetical protein PG997_013569 [Apiospora hydei]|uniref:Heterokaryon incompatibility domain-containing protein n=1 Tax=Apiospora hydei TaxID=1337664 RepID=A0ABR1V6J3_9PEZI